LSDAVSRRDFLKLMGASLALAGLGACARPAPTQEKILPYVNQPENWVPGKPCPCGKPELGHFFRWATPISL